MAAAVSVAAPGSHSQTSRKSKRAWRKNIDLEELSSGLESAREQRIHTGGKVLADLPASSLFETDTTGSDAIKKQYLKTHPKPLKADEILAARSAIPAVSSKKRSVDLIETANPKFSNGILPPKRQKASGVSAREYERLKRIAQGGQSTNSSIIAASTDTDHDPWAVTEQQKPDERFSFLEKAQPKRMPSTLKHAPVSQLADNKVLPNVLEPHAGRSYNPAFQDWQKLVTSAASKEVESEKQRLAADDAESERQKRISVSAAEADRADTEKENEAMQSGAESEWEGLESDVDENYLKRKRPERKTPAERNKWKRRKEAERLERHQSRMKHRDEQLKRLSQVRADMEAKEAHKTALQLARQEVVNPTTELLDDGATMALRRRQLSKTEIQPEMLEVALVDELTDSLRTLKPDGNLLHDRFRTMMVQGRLEARKPITQPKKAKRKATEKWSYKDFKVPT